MDLHVELGFVHRSFEPRFFVCTLDDRDPSYARGNRWQIQFLNDAGQGGANLDFGPFDNEDLFKSLPFQTTQSVVNTAKSGVQDYLDGNGVPWDPILLQPRR
jgi:hypothetical protein